ncbi:hypothetical protein W97_01101 [Coniosporium apollinis CBS 100218]|uniref:Uncharacterized protein n=1 Tax=Coniosporium apollinis (strain CBS 100218) TaxID=1168221 RepID=R7YJ18_CONA1|nr:uncharacterized protein W97_01101 [Coniosporium apollinis CBS 100218]EON61883.1 hypothetical protein W97_01101 [Coniosporium apollinis CBS 100218]
MAISSLACIIDAISHVLLRFFHLESTLRFFAKYTTNTPANLNILEFSDLCSAITNSLVQLRFLLLVTATALFYRHSTTLSIWAIPCLFLIVLLAGWYLVCIFRKHRNIGTEDDPSAQPTKSLASLCLNICCLTISLVLTIVVKVMVDATLEVQMSVPCTLYECYLATGKRPLGAATKRDIAGWLAILIACYALYIATFTVPDNETLRSPERGDVVREQIRQIGMLVLHHVARRNTAAWRAVAERYEAREAGRGGE